FSRDWSSDVCSSDLARMRIVDKIGYYKKANNVTVFQVNRWKEISDVRKQWAKALNLNEEFMEEFFKLIHDASIRRQTAIINSEDAGKNGVMESQKTDAR